MLSETSHESTHTTQFYLYEVPRMVKFTELEDTLEGVTTPLGVVKGWKREGKLVFNGDRISV